MSNCHIAIDPDRVPPEHALLGAVIRAIIGGLGFYNVRIDGPRYSFECLAHTHYKQPEAQQLSPGFITITLYAKIAHNLLFQMVHWINHGCFDEESMPGLVVLRDGFVVMMADEPLLSTPLLRLMQALFDHRHRLSSDQTWTLIRSLVFSIYVENRLIIQCSGHPPTPQSVRATFLS